MSVKIKETDRPHIPCEHPDARMYYTLFKENVRRQIYKKSKYHKNDVKIKYVFTQENINLKEKCNLLTAYIAEAFEHYSVWDNSYAYYPGRPSQQTAKTDALEGVSRVLPTLAAWLHASKGNADGPKKMDGQPIDIENMLFTAFLAGTDPKHRGYWGELSSYDQKICESADLALALWLAKDFIWSKYSETQQEQIITWFKQINHCKTVDNNWHLFILKVQFVIKNLTGEDFIAHDKYARIKEFYVGEGWFRDGAKGNYDYYNAWGFHYSLYWLDQIDPDFDAPFIHKALSAHVATYRYFFTPKGIPFFGRSACYRLAAAAPLIAALDQNSSAITVGEAKRAFRMSLEYFIRNDALKYGAPTQGLFADDARLVDNYSGPASCFWSMRALNIALFCGGRINLWDSAEDLLPIELGDFEFDIDAIAAKVIGIAKTQEVVVIFKEDYTEDQNPYTRTLLTQSIQSKFKEMLTGRADRPKNNLLRKGVTCYSSKMGTFF